MVLSMSPRIHASKYKPFHHRTFGMFGKLDYSILTHMLMLSVGSSWLVYVDGRLGSDGLVDEPPRIHASKYKPFHHRTFGMFGKLDYSILTHMLMLSGKFLAVLLVD